MEIPAARLRLVEELRHGWIRGRADHWFESGNPRQLMALTAQNSARQDAIVPADFWHVWHARGQTRDLSGTLPLTRISHIGADWKLNRFEITYPVSMGAPGCPATWGEKRAYPTFGEWLCANSD